MAEVYVQNKSGNPLMPTTRCGHVRILLKQKKANVVCRKPFTIRLLYDTPDITQPLYLGIDPGRMNIGLCVVDENGEARFAAQVVTRNNEIPKLMEKRKECRQKHRNCGRRQVKRRRARREGTVKGETFTRKLPGCEKSITLHDINNKEARFSNRFRPEGWLTPTANQLLQTHINVVKKIAKILPITDVVFELNKFAFMQLDNPDIRPWEYQRGQLFGYHGCVEDAVFAIQNGTCLFCEKGIDHYHHVVPRRKHGSNTLGNIVGLCEEHHTLVHTSDEWKESLKEIKDGLNKRYGALSVLNQIFKKLEMNLAAMYPSHTYCVSGRDTKEYRDTYGVEKYHWLDAYCIASIVVGNEAKDTKEIALFAIKQFRRHDRQACNQEMLNRKYLLDGKVVATNRRKAYEQEQDSLKEYRETLIKKVGIEGAEEHISQLIVKPHPPTMKDMHRVMPGSLLWDKSDKLSFVLQGTAGRHNGKPDYFVDTEGMKHRVSQCMVIHNNTGLRFVG